MARKSMAKSGGQAGFLSPRFMTYGYANARVRAMHPALLTRRQADDLLKVKTIAGIAEYLSRTAYKEDFSGMMANVGDEERVEIAVGRNFARTARKLLRITPSQSRPTLMAFLAVYDVHNLKTILLSKKLGKSKEQTAKLLIPAGTIGRQEIDSLFSARGGEELYAAIRATEFGSKFLSSASIRHIPKEQIKAAFQNPTSEGAKLDMFLSSLDFYYYEFASSAVMPGEKDAGIMTGLLRSQADAKNVITALRLRKNGADKTTIAKHMVSGGGFGKAQLDRMAAAKDISEIFSIANSFFLSETGRSEFAAAEARFKEDGQLSHFEVAFERSIARRSLHALHRSTMSLGAIAGFLFLKEEEMNNIQKIVRGKALGMPDEKISEMLVIVG